MPKIAEAPATYPADESWPSESLLTGRFDLPPEYAWFNELDAQARQDFFAGLLKVLVRPQLALPDGRRRSRQEALDEYLRGWRATIEIESNPNLVTAIKSAMHGPFYGPYDSVDKAFADMMQDE